MVLLLVLSEDGLCECFVNALVHAEHDAGSVRWTRLDRTYRLRLRVACRGRRVWALPYPAIADRCRMIGTIRTHPGSPGAMRCHHCTGDPLKARGRELTLAGRPSQDGGAGGRELLVSLSHRRLRVLVYTS